MHKNRYKQEKVFFVISGDSGGMRGYAQALIMEKIAEELGTQLDELSYLNVGTSTATLAFSGLMIPHFKNQADQPCPDRRRQYNESDIASFYKNDGASIFSNSSIDKANDEDAKRKRGIFNRMGNFLPNPFAFMQRKAVKLYRDKYLYDDANLKAVLQDNMGEVLARDLEGRFLFSTTDFHDKRGIWFTNEPCLAKHFDDVYFVPNMKMADIVEMCTRPNFIFPVESKTLYYKSYNQETGKWVDKTKEILPTDGAYFAATPDEEAYLFAKNLIEAQGYKKDEYRIVMLSLGNGQENIQYGEEDFNNNQFMGLFKQMVMSLNVAIATQYQRGKRLIKETMEREGDLYFRIDAIIDINNPDHPSIDLTDASDENMTKIANFAYHELLENNRAEFDQFIETAKEYQKTGMIEKAAKKWLGDYFTPLKGQRGLFGLGRRRKKIGPKNH